MMHWCGQIQMQTKNGKRTCFSDGRGSGTGRIRFIARGPKVAFCGHSFTGLWDSSYYYFRELAKMGGWKQ